MASVRPVIIWRGHGTDQGIYATEINDGVVSPTQQAQGSASRRGIGAARLPRARGSGYLVAWRGGDADNRIWIRHGSGVDQGVQGWASEQRRPPGDPRTEDRPALAIFGDDNVMAWRGADADADEHIWFATSSGWRQQVACDGIASSTHGPALAALADGRLLMAWKGSGGNQGLYWSVYDGATWTYPASLPAGSTHGPALATAHNGSTVMVWKGSGADDRIWTAAFRGDDWTSQQLAVGRTSHGPALAVVGAGLVMVWKGAPGDERLFWSTDLRTQREVAPGYTTADTPAVTYADWATL